MRTDDHAGVAAAAAVDVPVIDTADAATWAALLAPLEPDLLLCAAFPSRLPTAVLALPRIGAINGHNSLLPRYRGPNPQGWALRNGDPETGFTVHRMVDEFDAGPVLAQVRCPLTDEDDINTLGERVRAALPGVYATAFERLARGELGDPQDEAAATAAPMFEDGAERVDWGAAALTIHRQVRSLFEVPGRAAGGLAELCGRSVRLLATRLVEHVTPDATNAAAPGTVLRDDGDELVVQCGDGPLRVTAWVKG